MKHIFVFLLVISLLSCSSKNKVHQLVKSEASIEILDSTLINESEVQLSMISSCQQYDSTVVYIDPFTNRVSCINQDGDIYFSPKISQKIGGGPVIASIYADTLDVLFTKLNRIARFSIKDKEYLETIDLGLPEEMSIINYKSSFFTYDGNGWFIPTHIKRESGDYYKDSKILSYINRDGQYIKSGGEFPASLHNTLLTLNYQFFAELGSDKIYLQHCMNNNLIVVDKNTFEVIEEISSEHNTINYDILDLSENELKRIYKNRRSYVANGYDQLAVDEENKKIYFSIMGSKYEYQFRKKSSKWLVMYDLDKDTFTVNKIPRNYYLSNYVRNNTLTFMKNTNREGEKKYLVRARVI